MKALTLLLAILFVGCDNDDMVCYECTTTEVIDVIPATATYPRTSTWVETSCNGDKSGQFMSTANRDGIVSTKTTTVVCQKK